MSFVTTAPELAARLDKLVALLTPAFAALRGQPELIETLQAELHSYYTEMWQHGFTEGLQSAIRVVARVRGVDSLSEQQAVILTGLMDGLLDLKAQAQRPRNAESPPA